MSPERSNTVSEAEIVFRRLQSWGENLGFETGFLENEVTRLHARDLDRLNADLVAQLGRTARLERQNKLGTVSGETYRVEMNKISAAFVYTCQVHFGSTTGLQIQDQKTHGRPTSIEVNYSCGQCGTMNGNSYYRGGGCPGCGHPGAVIHSRKIIFLDGYATTYS